MDDVETHVTRPGLTHDRVQVRAVVVQKSAGFVDQTGDLGDVLVEDTERVRVGQHQAGDVFIDLGPEVLDIHPALLVGRDLDHFVAGHGHRGRVGPVSGVGGQDLGRVPALVGVVGPGQEQPGQLALGPGRRLEAHGRQSADLGKRFLQQVHQLKRTLGVSRIGRRMKLRVTGQRRDPLVQARVVLHGAGTERVEAGVEVEVPAGEAVVVTDDLRLGNLGQLGGFLAQKAGRDQILDRSLFEPVTERGQLGGPAARDRLLVDRGRAVGLLRSFGQSRFTHWTAPATGLPSSSCSWMCSPQPAWACSSMWASQPISSTERFSVIATRKQSSYSG